MISIRKIAITLSFFVFLSSCGKISDLESKVDRLDSRLTALEQECQRMNSNISALQSLVEALQSQDGVVSVTDLQDGTGYSITFKSGRTIKLHNGTDGKTPVVGVKMDSDGVYYWTVDGEWLKDSAGKKIRAQGVDGQDAVAPQLKIEDEYWYISYDGGKAWTKMYKATGEDGDSVFASVTENAETVTIKLKDGTTFDVPKAKGELGIRFSEFEDIGITAGETRTIEYSILNGSVDTRVKIFGSSGWTVKLQKKNASEGSIVVTAPSPLTDGEVAVFVYEGDSKTVVRFLNFVKGTITAPQAAYSFSGKAGDYGVYLDTNVDYEVSVPSEAAGWLTYSGINTKAMRQDTLRFHCTQNFGPDERSAVVKVVYKAGADTVKITVTQKVWDAIDIPDANFKAALVAQFDKDGDGEIGKAEAEAVTQISVSGKDIASLEGLENFPNLVQLDCSYNKLSTIDLSGNPKLAILSIAHNLFTSIDLSKVSLFTFVCFDNNLSSLDLSGQTNLQSISCGGNVNLKTLDLSGCASDLGIMALGCTNLSEIYILKSQTVSFKQIPSTTKIKCLTPDGTVTLLQKHTVGNGIKFVIMGDGYLRSGLTCEYGGKSKFDTWAENAMEAIFTEEPYKTFRNRFDVYSVAVESTTESFSGNTALGCTFGSGTRVNVNSTKTFEYARKVSGIELAKTVIIVILNSTKYAGTCWMWSTGEAIACVPTTYNDVTEFSQTIHHEAGGHAFAKLDDEYYYSGTITSSEISNHKWWYTYADGAYANVDVTSDATQVHWAHFISDSRYSGQVGVYEGAMTYRYGAYRPTDHSIMRHNVGGYNAPSREAIYKRIMKLSEGSGWEYDYETFVAYDAVNRSNASQTYYREEVENFDESTFVPLAPPVWVDRDEAWRLTD